MLPVAVHAGAELSAGVEDAEAVAAAPSVDVADDDDAPVHPLTASSKLAAATSAANWCVVLFS
jgi:hypothetical protein